MEALTLKSAAKSIENLSVRDAAREVPLLYLGVLSGEGDTVVESSDLGFLIRAEDIRNVRVYAREAKTLALTLGDVKKYLGYDKIDILELSPESILSFNKSVKAHADTWGGVENTTKELARKLDAFAKDFITIGKFVINKVNSVRANKGFTSTLADLTEQERRELKAVLLGDTKADVIAELNDYLERALEKTNEFVTSVKGVEALAKEFERELTEDLIPALGVKLQAYKQPGHKNTRDNLLDEIEELDEQITAKANTYKQQVGLSFTGIFLGAIGLAFSGGIFGSKAEATRKQKNKLVAQRNKLRAEVKDFDRVAALLDTFQQQFSDLHGRMFSAEVGAKQLAQVWMFIHRYLEEAKSGLEDIDTMEKLHMFALEFSLVLNPWEKIKNYSSQILNAFNELIKSNKN